MGINVNEMGMSRLVARVGSKVNTSSGIAIHKTCVIYRRQRHAGDAKYNNIKSRYGTVVRKMRADTQEQVNAQTVAK